MSGSGYDPFDVTHTDQPYDEARGGLNPDFARNLLAFGAAAMTGANARTPQGFLANGTGPLGGIGAGIQGAMQQNLAAGRTRSELGYQGAQTQNALAEAALRRMQIPFEQQRLQMLSDPNIMNPQPPGQSLSAAPFTSGGGGGIALGMRQNNPENLEFAGQPGAAPGQGNRFATFPDMASGIAASANQLALNQTQHGVNTVRGQVTRWVSDPKADLTSYIADTAKALGVSPDAPIDWTNPTAQAKFLLAQQPHESAGGGARLDPADVQKGVQMAALQRGQQVQRQAPYQVATAGPTIPPPPTGTSQSAPGGAQTAQAGAEPLAVPQSAGGAAPMPQMPAGNVPQMAAGAPQPDQRALANARYFGQLAVRNQMLKLDATPFTQQAELWGRLAFAGPMAQENERVKSLYQLASEGYYQTPQGSFHFIPGSKADPALQAQQEGAKTRASEAEKYITDRFGNIYKNGQLLGRGSEVKPSYDQNTGYETYADVGGIGIGAPSNLGAAGHSGGVIAGPGPGLKQQLENVPQIEKNFLENDRKYVESDLGHVIENAAPAQASLRQIRALTPEAATGAAGTMRAEIKSWVQTFAPDLAEKMDFDASPAQQMAKLSLLGAGRQERGDVGARGGFRLTELYLKANPGLEMLPDANIRMANSLLVAHQYHIDYANGAGDFFNKSSDAYLANPAHSRYQVLTKYDNAFTQTMKPEVYVAAIGALNGDPSSKWANGLTAKQAQIVFGIINRVDPTAVIDMGGKQKVPVSSIKNMTGPQDIGPPPPAAANAN